MIEHHEHILSVKTSFCPYIIYIYMYVCMYVENVSVCVNELVFISVYSISVYDGYINANIDLWWVVLS